MNQQKNKRETVFLTSEWMGPEEKQEKFIMALGASNFFEQPCHDKKSPRPFSPDGFEKIEKKMMRLVFEGFGLAFHGE